jgi:hypothetical protein
MDEPKTPLEAYRAILKELATETSNGSSTANVVVSAGNFPPGSYHSRFNFLISSLDPQQRSMLAELLLDERAGTVFDVLATLSWWIECRDVRLTFKGKRLPVGEDGLGMHEAFLYFRPPVELPDDDA